MKKRRPKTSPTETPGQENTVENPNEDTSSDAPVIVEAPVVEAVVEPVAEVQAVTPPVEEPQSEQKAPVVVDTGVIATPRFLRRTSLEQPAAVEPTVEKTSTARAASPMDDLVAKFDAENDEILRPLVLTLRRYMNDMQPNTEVDDRATARSQSLLYMTLMDIVTRKSAQEFRKLWQFVLLVAHHHRDGVFDPRNLFRGASVWTREPESLDTFHALLNLIVATANPATRATGLKTVSLPQTVSRLKNEQAAQQLIAFYR